ncbi:MAG: PCYCGC motif-containing (lipo)protein [Nitrospinota bacterium]
MWGVVFGLAVVGFGGGYSYYRFTRTIEVDAARGLRAEARGPTRAWRFIERRPVLPASLFVGRVHEAYAAASRTPEVFDRLYCYCRCKEGHGHKTLLTCFTVTHAST